jgi:2-polyprenyl-3-methyl-5-hydroxy-6-metoxy-1,4-benzoquinol methylase
MSLQPRCRFCSASLSVSFADLGMSPLSNSYLASEQLNRMERFYPLHAWVCEACLLVQLEQFETPENIFSDYAYFSSYSDSWLEHARKYAHDSIARLGLQSSSLVVEVASNDGYLLQYFAQRGISVLGIEPAANVAAAAERRGVPTCVKFFGVQTAKELVAAGKRADLLIGNNVLAHVPDLNDFVGGLALLLKPDGVITVEFPHLLTLMAESQFDTIYHEHFSYFSFRTAEKIFGAHGLSVFDVEELSTHGGSLRLYAAHQAASRHVRSDRVAQLRARETVFGLDNLRSYSAFADQVRAAKRSLLQFLIQAREAGKRVAGYGAPAKGNTLLNYCGVRTDLLEYTVDRSPHKQGRYLPGTHIPIHAPEMIFRTKPEYVLILPWNLQDEIVEQMRDVRAWGGRFVVPIPQARVLD